jgi:hypothetical protein
MTLMNDCLSPPVTRGKLTPNKRTNYALGMVLGADDFLQEQLHFEWKSRLSNLLLHGYGTVCGLQVSAAPKGTDVEVKIAPGVAISPRGNWIVVQNPQCATLGEWVRRSADAPAFGGRIGVYVTLCYQECEVDLVPLAGRPCSTEDETRHASRILESFRAHFSWEAPEQATEDGIRALGDLLHRVEVSDQPLSPPAGGNTAGDDADTLFEQVRALAGAGASPPAGGGPLRLDPATACETLRRALSIWVTEVRPHVGAATPEGDCLPNDKSGDCLLLARLEFDVDAAGFILGGADAVAIDEKRRPVLLPTRLLQELLSCERAPAPTTVTVGAPAAPALPQQTFATLFLLNPTTIRAWLHHPRPLTIPVTAVEVRSDVGANSTFATPASVTPVAGQSVFDLKLPAGQTVADEARVGVTFDARLITEVGPPSRRLDAALADADFDYVDRSGTFLSSYLPVRIAPAPPGPGVTSHGALTGLDADDHKQYLLVDGARAMSGDLQMGERKITNLAEGVAADDAVRVDQAIKDGDAAGGDLSETYPNPKVQGLQGRTVADSVPTAGQVLTWNEPDKQWEPADLPAPAPPTDNGRFVAAPAGPYAVLAAAYIAVNASGTPKVVSAFDDPKFKVSRAAGSPNYLIQFSGYEPDLAKRRVYVVKGTVHVVPKLTDQARHPQFFVSDFADEGIEVQISDDSGNVQRFVGFMIEISQVTKPVG